MTLDCAIKMLKTEYDKALKRDDVNNPLVYALRWVLKQAESDITSKEIVDIRTKLDMSVTEFSKLIGVSRTTVYSYESGKKLPRAETAKKIYKLIEEGKKNDN